MTTIITHKGQLIADRRKVVNGHHNGLIGIRNESKIGTTPYCVFGTTGFEFFDKDSKDKYGDITQQLALVFAFSHFVESAFINSPLYDSVGIGQIDGFFKFRTRCRQMRDIHGQWLSHKLFDQDQHLIAMNREFIYLALYKSFYTHQRQDQIVIGAGRKMADILLDHGLSYEDVYHTLSVSGVPTGSTYETLSPNDLPNLFPPVCDENFLVALYESMLEIQDDDIKRKLSDADDLKTQTKHLTELIAVFYSMGEMKDNVITFNPDMRFDFVCGESRDTVYWQKACDLTGHKDEPKEEKAAAQ